MSHSDVDVSVDIDVIFPDHTQTLSFSLLLSNTIHDVRQVILELMLAPPHTCFHLEYKREQLHSFLEIGQIPHLKLSKTRKIVLEVVLDPYTERESKYHIYTLLEFLSRKLPSSSTSPGIRAGFCIFPSLNIPSGENLQIKSSSSLEEINKIPENIVTQSLSYTNLLKKFETSPNPSNNGCFRSLALSGWNPVPAEFVIQGHLLYLTVLTIEGKTYNITSHVSGFYVNNCTSTKFDPSPCDDLQSHSLVLLLEQLSPLFKERLHLSLNDYKSGDAIAQASITGTLPQAPWITFPVPHRADLSRTQKSELFPYIENQGNLRDWNEEIQSTREMDHEDVQDRVLRERLTVKTLQDFTDMAVEGAIDMVNGNIPSLNPLEPTASQMFVHNNIFFSYGRDSVGIFSTKGGDSAAYSAVGKDILAIRLLNQFDLSNPSLLGTCVVDYAGHRVVAQTIVPGIFKQLENGSSHLIYGKVEGESDFRFDESFEGELSRISDLLHIKKHFFVDGKEKSFPLYTSMDAKALKGSDGRTYLMDLYSLFPLDAQFLEVISDEKNEEFPAYPHKLVHVRPELVQLFYEMKLQAFVNANHNDAEEKNLNDSLKSVELEGNGIKLSSEKGKNNVNKVRNDNARFDCGFNPDCFRSDYIFPPDNKELYDKDIENSYALSQYLHAEVIPNFVKSLSEPSSFLPIDGVALCRAMHRSGINIRYLGEIANIILQKSPNNVILLKLVTSEIFIRSIKHVFRNFLAVVPQVLRSHLLSHLLNNLFTVYGYAEPTKPLINENIANLFFQATQVIYSINSTSLYSSIKKEASSRFRFNLTDDLLHSLNPICILRGTCLRLGIQISCKDYFSNKSDDKICEEHAVPNGSTKFTGKKGNKKKRNLGKSQNTTNRQVESEQINIFQPKDILNLMPVIKTCIPYSGLAQESLEACKACLLQGNKELCYNLLNESLSLHEQIYGVLHTEVARAYCQLAMIYHQLEKKEEAVELARKAVIVCERFLGFDSSETSLAYMNLSLYEFSQKNEMQAVMHMQHALKLWYLVFGPDHPNTINSFTNLSLMLHGSEKFIQSQKCLQIAVDLSDKIFGKTTPTASLYLQLAQLMVLNKDSRSALHAVRVAYDILKETLGPDHQNTKEAEHWLSEFTALAVNQERQSRT